eukprot:TRINITY_DN12903_c0_g1_i2.p1 TRINITY_DN12903_c0_g1~~TRINITY_DN12903_c0_g1_i2.p1  ORF type:complete len:236 (+),score=59.66 TRINITY_DN12903_c0_g1_i2:102-809(+)
MTWLRDAAKRTVEFLLHDDGEDPDEALHRALGHHAKEDDDGDPYADLARVDQVLHFFEYEASKVEGFVSEEAGLAEELEQKRQEYYNMVNSIEVQNQRIEHLVSDLLRLRSDFRERKNGGRTKEKLVEIAQVKLDIGDCKNKRFFKDKRRKEVHGELIPIITRVQTARLMAEQEFKKAESVVTPEREAVHTASETQAVPRSSTVRKRAGAYAGKRTGGGRQRYTDSELTALLKED